MTGHYHCGCETYPRKRAPGRYARRLAFAAMVLCCTVDAPRRPAPGSAALVSAAPGVCCTGVLLHWCLLHWCLLHWAAAASPAILAQPGPRAGFRSLRGRDTVPAADPGGGGPAAAPSGDPPGGMAGLGDRPRCPGQPGIRDHGRDAGRPRADPVAGQPAVAGPAAGLRGGGPDRGGGGQPPDRRDGVAGQLGGYRRARSDAPRLVPAARGRAADPVLPVASAPFVEARGAGQRVSLPADRRGTDVRDHADRAGPGRAGDLLATPQRPVAGPALAGQHRAGDGLRAEDRHRQLPARPGRRGRGPGVRRHAVHLAGAAARAVRVPRG